VNNWVLKQDPREMNDDQMLELALKVMMLQQVKMIRLQAILL
jgi:hypothetical protein